MTGHPPGAVVAEWHEAGRDIPAFSHELVEGVEAHLPSIDLLLERDAEEWSVDRMTSLDRTILRIAVEELLYRDDVPRRSRSARPSRQRRSCPPMNPSGS